MQFDFDKETVANNYIDLDEIGHCAIRASNDDLEDYYLIIQTVMGKSLIFQYGPIIQDMDMLPDEVYCSVRKIDYNEKKVGDVIKYFLNDTKKRLKYAEVLTVQECLDDCKDLLAYTKEFEVTYNGG